MNRNLEELKIKRWFHEARQVDAARAPAFADLLAAAQSHPRRGVWGFAWGLAFVCGVLIVLGVAVFFKRQANEPTRQAAVALLPAYPQRLRAVTGPERRMPALPEKIRQLARTRRVAQPRAGVEASALLSFKWQSPTDFLLRTPGADLLKSVPRVTDSVIRFDN